MNRKINAFLLAAGSGERLRPITDHIPKPLIPILGKPVLENILEQVVKLPLGGIGINLHYRREILQGWISQSPFREKIQLFPEEPVLGTGGALKNAEAFLKGRTFLVHNSDVLSDIDLNKLLEFHLRSGSLVTLAAHDSPELNNIYIDEKGFLTMTKEVGSLPEGTVKLLTFSGVAVYSPEFLQFVPKGVSSVVDAWLKALSAGFKIATLDITECFWSDIGKPSSYASTVFGRLRSAGETVYIHPSARGCSSADIDGYVVLEKESVLDQSVFLRNCIVLPESHIESKTHHENCIIGQGFTVELKEHEMFGSPEESDKILIGIGGSDRKYYRIKRGAETAVFMQCNINNRDFLRHMEYTHFFLKHVIPVPELVLVEPDKMRAIFEDLGDISLYSWLKCPRENGQIGDMYRKVMDILVLLHTEATKNVSECPILQKRVFDYDHFRWETSYFVERFVKGIKRREVNHLSGLDEEFHRLALKADSFPKTVIHRDFQSQNIMIKKGGIPRVIDYQGARIGPPAYDVISILWDPYYRLDNDMRDHLLQYYMNEMAKRLGEKWNEPDFRETLMTCRLQRHMQSLGAYGFLSAVKGKKYFLKYVPEALRLLREDISLTQAEYPVLYDLISTLIRG